MLTPEQRQRAREIAAQAPPLTAEQRDLLARIFGRQRHATQNELPAARTAA